MNVKVARLSHHAQRGRLGPGLLGGNGSELGQDIALDASGNAYVIGRTSSTGFPAASPPQASLRGPQDALVAKLNAAGSALVYSSYLGGSGSEEGWGIAADASGNACVTGSTDSSDFPTVGPLQGSLRGSSDAVFAKIALTDYLVGNTFPATGDSLERFGDGALNVLDLIYACRAFVRRVRTALTPWTPSQWTLRRRGAATRRVTSVDTSRPRRRAASRRARVRAPVIAEARQGKNHRITMLTVLLLTPLTIRITGTSLPVGAEAGTVRFYLVDAGEPGRSEVQD